MAVSGLRYWVDYDRENNLLAPLSAFERVDYLEERVRLVVIRPLRRLLDTEIIVPDSSAVLIFGVALCCAIEATGKFVNGPGTGRGINERRFRAFLHRYMAPDYRKRKMGGMRFGTVLWKHFRNGLAHGFTVCHGGFEGAPGEAYFRVKTIAGQRCLEINPTRFLGDYEAGFARYLSELRAAGARSARRRHFDRVFEEVFILGK